MSTVNTGWLKDNNGEKFAPKTLSSQVINKDGISIDTLLNNIIIDDARDVGYDNTSSGLSATNVQDAMDEIQQEIDNLSKGMNLSTLTMSVTSIDGGNRLTLSDGTTTKSVDIPSAKITNEQVQESVETWLNEHPEATTTVQDGAVTFKKLGDDVAEKIKNHITYPAFEDITDSSKVQFVYVSTKSVVDGVLTFGKTSNGQFRALIKSSNSYIAGHMYYMDVQCKIDDPTSTNASTVHVETQKSKVYLEPISEWQRVYWNFVPSNVEVEHIKVGRDDSDTGALNINVKTPVLFDLTEAFGVGNEPSANEFKVILDELCDTDKPIYGVFKESYKLKTIERVTNNLYAQNWLETNINDNASQWGEIIRTVTGDGSREVIETSFTFKSGTVGKCNTYTGNYGDVIYFAASVLFDDDDCIKISMDTVSNMITDSTKYRNYIDSPTKNTWHRLSMVFSHEGVCYPHVALHYPDSARQKNKVLQYRYGILLNLTQIFGKGNEPSVEVMDTLLSSFSNGWFKGTSNIFNANVLTKVFPQYHNIYDKSGYGSENGRFVARSITDKNADCWKIGKYKYGINNTNDVPIPHDFFGSVKTDSMFISDGQYGAWSTDASGELSYGGHVFHGWNEIGTYRLSMMIGNSCVGGDKREDEAAILVYSPTKLFNNPSRPLTDEQLANRITPNSEDYYGNNPDLLLGRIRIGSDVHNEGVVFQRKKTTFYGDVILKNSYGAVTDVEGTQGMIKYDTNYLYICVKDGIWKKVALSDI